jgi:hypothetical protein
VLDDIRKHDNVRGDCRRDMLVANYSGDKVPASHNADKELSLLYLAYLNTTMLVLFFLNYLQ